MVKVTSIHKKKKVEFIEAINGDFNCVFDCIDEGVVIVNNEGEIVYANPAYEEMFRVSRTTIIGKNIFCVLNDDAMIKAFKQKKKIKGKLNYCINTNQIYVSASPIYEENHFKGVIGIYTDKLPDNEQNHLSKIVPLNQSNGISEIKVNSYFQKIITNSRNMQEALFVAERASKVPSTVLIRGESGTGKELVAKAIYYTSNRKNKPFIRVNCGAIPAALLESELFGHELGAFTGAIKKKIGKFEEANGGTLFLDEIGDMPIDMQVKILRVLQEKEFERVGGNETIKCDVRFLAATHRNLEELVEKEEFREDLYYRLNVISIHIPSLRERIEDINDLCIYFIDKINAKTGREVKGLSKEVKEAFCQYDWPGNVRELENLMESLIVLAEGDIIQLSEIPHYISNIYHVNNYGIKGSSLINTGEKGELPTLEEYEREIIKLALDRHGSFNAAGKALGVTHRTIALKARKYNIVD